LCVKKKKHHNTWGAWVIQLEARMALHWTNLDSALPFF
jgi:hypothetical protein